MQDPTLAYIYALSSVLTFSTAAVGFTYFSRKVSALWMNVFKCWVSLVCAVGVLFVTGGNFLWSWQASWPLLLSGFIGLNVADWFLLSAYRLMGPGRTLILFGFQPLITGSFAYFLWEESLYPIQFVAILLFILCLFLFSLENFRRRGQWELRGLAIALTGVFLDSAGVLLTRYAFQEVPEMNGLDVHYLRSLGASLSFFLYMPFISIGFMQGLRALSGKEKSLALLSGVSGTFLSLVFYMQALKLGKLATVNAVVLTDPVLSTFMECLWLRLWPSRYLWLALACFLMALACLLSPHF